MREKLQTRAFERVAPMLQPGEVPVVAVRATVGRFSSGRLGAVVSTAVTMEIGGALGSALVSTRNQYVVLTSHRLFFLSQTALGAPGGKVLGQVPRAQVALVETRIGFVSLLRIAFGDQGDGVALTLPRVDKRNAEQLAAALQPLPQPTEHSGHPPL